MDGSVAGSPTKEEFLHLSKDEIVERVVELELELQEFQESSRELEKALEDELAALETANAKLKQSLHDSKTMTAELYGQIKTLNQQVSELQDAVSAKTIEADTQIRSLKQQLVEVEITNDNMESNDRVMSTNLERVNQFNAELLEKIALLENDLHHERKLNAERSLLSTNDQNTIQQLEAKLAEYERRDGEVDTSYLSMRDMLRDGPPVSPAAHGLPKSDSLQKLHELSVRSEGISKKVKSLRRQSLYIASPVKSPSTTQISRHLHTSRSNKENEFGKSKTSKSLTTMLYKEAAQPLEPIAGSPAKPSAAPKPRKRKNLLGNLKALALGH